MHWMVYKHPDGREARALDDGRCTDPELQALLQAHRAARAPREPVLKRPLQEPVVIALARRLLRLLNRLGLG